MDLSRRLQTLVDMVPEVSSFVDIGCDHGYVPIILVQKERVKKAIAMDVNRGPIERANCNIKANAYEEKIETRLSNGFDALEIGEADCALLAGMGGKLICSILLKEVLKTKAMDYLILQPQSDMYEVRLLMPELGFSCVDEEIVKEDGKYYFLMKFRNEADKKEKYSQVELRYGKFLLAKKAPILLQYLNNKKKEYQKILLSIDAASEQTVYQEKRVKEINMELQYIKEATAYFEGEG